MNKPELGLPDKAVKRIAQDVSGDTLNDSEDKIRRIMRDDQYGGQLRDELWAIISEVRKKISPEVVDKAVSDNIGYWTQAVNDVASELEFEGVGSNGIEAITEKHKQEYIAKLKAKLEEVFNEWDSESNEEVAVYEMTESMVESLV